MVLSSKKIYMICVCTEHSRSSNKDLSVDN